MSTYALRHSISITVNDTAARRLLLSTDVVSGVEKCFIAFMVIPTQFCVTRWKEKSCVDFRRQISMASGDVRRMDKFHVVGFLAENSDKNI